MSNHAAFDNGYYEVYTAANRKRGDANPSMSAGRSAGISRMQNRRETAGGRHVITHDDSCTSKCPAAHGVITCDSSLISCSRFLFLR